jgi:opacity protein-like surface antigen
MTQTNHLGINHMKKLLIATAVATTLFAPQAFAQAKNFEGFSIAGNVTSAKSTTTTTGNTAAGINGDDSGTSAGVDLQLGYNVALGQSFVLGLGVTVGTGANKAGTIGTSEFTLKNRASFDLTPGFAVSDSVLIFGKISGIAATVEPTAGTFTGSQTVSGIGYGIGLRAHLDKNLFLQAIYDTNKYEKYNTVGNATTLENKSGVFSFGVGYKF